MSSWGNDEIVKEDGLYVFESLHGAEFIERVRAAHKALEGNLIEACNTEFNTLCNSATTGATSVKTDDDVFVVGNPLASVKNNRTRIEGIRNVYEANCTSVGRNPKRDWEPTEDWWLQQLHGQDSTLEWCHVTCFVEMRGDVASHLVRHTKGHPRFVVTSGRPDWTGKNRKGHEELRTVALHFTPYAFIEICRQRLCHSAMRETRQTLETLCRAFELSGDMLLSVLGKYAMPDCLYRGGVCHMNRKSWSNCRMLPHWRDV